MLSTNLLLSLAVALSTLAIEGRAWQTADDCTGEDLKIVNAAVVEALNMAMYAKFRAADTIFPRKGTPLQNYLGAPDEDDPTSLGLVQTWMQNVFNVASAPTTPESGVLIHCSDAHLTKTDDRKYIDTTRGKNDLISLPKPPPEIVATDNACGGFMQGFAYKGVVILCNDGPKSAFSEIRGDAVFGAWRTGGDLRTNPLVKTYGINEMSHYMSHKVLHEMMHVASLAQPFGSDRQFPGDLPDKVNGVAISELYGYQRITGLELGEEGPSANPPSANNRQHNADSFAFLATSWYLPAYG